MNARATSPSKKREDANDDCPGGIINLKPEENGAHALHWCNRVYKKRCHSGKKNCVYTVRPCAVEKVPESILETGGTRGKRGEGVLSKIGGKVQGGSTTLGINQIARRWGSGEFLTEVGVQGGENRVSLN